MTLSAALIVRNEADNLARCLESVKDVVDEIVVVDTGSTDASVGIAKSYGARTGFFEWIDDFAAARNHALDMVQTDWVLSIDADEVLWLAPGALEKVESRPTCHTVYVALVHAGTEQYVRGSRLFKKLPGTAWDAPIHEAITQPEGSGSPTDLSDEIKLIHYGYTEANIAAKRERNMRIERAYLERNPNHVRTLFHFARECVHAGLASQSPELGAEALEAAERLLALEDVQEGFEADGLALAAWAAGLQNEWQKVAGYAKEARRRGLPSVWTEYMYAVALMYLKDPRKALDAARRACDMEMPIGSGVGLEANVVLQRFQLMQAIENDLRTPRPRG